MGAKAYKNKKCTPAELFAVTRELPKKVLI
jgi:hypothetical protein